MSTLHFNGRLLYVLRPWRIPPLLSPPTIAEARAISWCLCRSSSNTSQIDLYQRLNVSRTASSQEIKSAYFQLAKKYHPDAKGKDEGNLSKFQEVCAAYEVLGDETRRQEYDRWGTTCDDIRRSGRARARSTNQRKWKKNTLETFSKMFH